MTSCELKLATEGLTKVMTHKNASCHSATVLNGDFMFVKLIDELSSNTHSSASFSNTETIKSGDSSQKAQAIVSYDLS